MKKNIIIILYLIYATWLNAELIVRQDRNGKISVSNIPQYSTTNHAKKIRFVRQSNSHSVPANYLSIIKDLSQKFQLREDLIIAVARAESSFNPFAISKKGAIGIMQLMPDTAKKYGVENRFNITQNMKAGVQHLKYLFHKYKKNIPLTLAAYNAGEDAVRKYHGIPPFRETNTYIRKIMKEIGLSYSSYFKPKIKTKIYKYETTDGRIVITDSLPAKISGKVEIIE